MHGHTNSKLKKKEKKKERKKEKQQSFLVPIKKIGLEVSAITVQCQFNPRR
jgi:hypothetical protein